MKSASVIAVALGASLGWATDAAAQDAAAASEAPAAADPPATSEASAPEEAADAESGEAPAEEDAPAEDAPAEEEAEEDAPAEDAPAEEEAAAEPPVAEEAAEEPAADEEAEEDPDPEPVEFEQRGQARTRGQGFYLRMALGVGHAWAEATDETDLSVNTTSWTGNFLVDAGYSFGQGFAVHADLYGAYAMSYDVDSNDDDTVVTSDGAALSMNILGVGATYHIMPVDIFVSAGIGPSFAFATSWETVADSETGQTTTTAENDNTDPGFGVYTSLGKLFPVSNAWALGGSANYAYMTFGARDASAVTLDRVHSFWLGFSAAYSP